MVLIFELARWQATRSWVLCFAVPCGCFIGFWPLRAAGTRWSSWKWNGVGLRAAITSTELITLKADSHIACRAHAVSLPCRAAKGLKCVFPIWFTQCGHVLFTLAMPRSDHAVLLKATAQSRQETTCGRSARYRLLPATMRSSRNVVIRSILISDAGGQYETKKSVLFWCKDISASIIYSTKIMITI